MTNSDIPIPQRLQDLRVGCARVIDGVRYERCLDDRFCAYTDPAAIPHADLVGLVADIITVLYENGRDGLRALDLDAGGAGGADAVDAIIALLQEHGLVPAEVPAAGGAGDQAHDAQPAAS